MPEQIFPLIQKVACQFARRLPPYIRVDDLLGAGWVGYMEACERFDPSRDTAFAAYAEYRIKGAMLDELRRLDPLGRDARPQVRRLEKVRGALTQELNRYPSQEELADRLQVSVERVKYLEYLETAGVEILEDHTDPHSRLARANAGVEEEEERLLDLQEALQVGRRLEESFKCLEPREERVIRAYFYEDMREREIGEKLGLTESRICQILGDALSKLRPIYEAITRAEQSLKRESLRSAADYSVGVPAQDLAALQADLQEAIAAERSSNDPKEGS